MKIAFAAFVLTCTAAPAVNNRFAEPLDRRMVERRGVETAIWGMPIVSFDAMRQAFFRAGAKYGDILYLSKPAGWKFRVTTPNASSLYVYLNYNLTDGPVVLDFPAVVGAGLFGSLNDAWQAPLTDVGPKGEDQGNGGKYLLLPPGHQGAAPQGYFPVPSRTYNGYAIFRAIPASSSLADVAKALDLVRKMRVYPLAQEANPPASRHIDIAGQLFDGIVHYDDTFYDSLARMVNEEPVQTRDLVPMQQLASIGIVRGHGFKPDAETRGILKKSISEAQAWFMDAIANGESWWPQQHWILSSAASGQTTGFSFQSPDRLNIDDRGALFFMACAPPKKLGAATFYLAAFRDGKDEPFEGDRTYRLRIPPNVPAKQFWAVTAYDLETAGFIREAPSLAVDSYQNVQKNADGSVDVYFGPAAPAGKQSNWIRTEPGKRWFTFFRFYGPEQAVFDKSWKLPDIVEESVTSSAPAAAPVPVTAANFNRAESDRYLAGIVKDGGFAKFLHFREFVPIDHQTVIRSNRDTLYSAAVFDLDAGPVTVTLPDPGKRFMSMQAINEDHYVLGVNYGAGRHTFTRDQAGTRYLLIAVRMLADPSDPKDLERAHALQDAIHVTQSHTGRFEVPNWDTVSQKEVRDALLVLGDTVPDTRHMFGAKDEVDPVRHLIGTAMAWGGNPEKDAFYLTVVPTRNDGSTVYRLKVKEVPVDGFWSISVYNREGYFEPNQYDSYTLNNLTAKRSADGAVDIQFGGCDGKIPNCLPTVPGWNYTVRLYRPRAEILDGTWTFPDAKPVAPAGTASRSRE